MPRRAEILSLTGLRGLAALWVFGYHLRPTILDARPTLPLDWLNNGFLGVDVFFVLSGFILSCTYGGRVRCARDYGFFIRNRLVRIYPLHLAILLGLVVAILLMSRLGIQVNYPEHFRFDHHLVLNALLLHSWGFEHALSWNVPSWSISAEFFAYLLFPLFYALASRPRTRWEIAALAALCLALMLLALRLLGHESLHVPTRHTLIRVSCEFLAGCLTYRIFRLRSRSRSGAGVWASCCVAAIFLLAVSRFADPWMAFGACLLVYALATEEGLASRILSMRPLVWLGTISYSIYLTHLPIISAARKLVPRDARMDLTSWEAVALLAATTLAVIGVSALCFYGLEAPARRLLRADPSRVPERAPAALGGDLAP